MKKIILLLIGILLLSGCNTVIADKTGSGKSEPTEYDLGFSQAENDSSYSINGSTYITLGDEDVKIRKAGTYILEGTLNGSVIIEVSESEDVKLVLNNATINSGDFAGIYIIEGDEITITLAEGSVNYITDSGEYNQIDDNNVDALIYSKADLIINGSGTLNLYSDTNHGIVSKDDLVITGGTYNVDVAGQGLRGKDRVKIYDGDFTIKSGKDSIKSDNNEDAYRGYVYITGGSFNIETNGDGIYGYNLVEIEGGDFNITSSKSSATSSYKGIKSDIAIKILDGTFNIDTIDDCIHSDLDVYIAEGTYILNSSDDAIHGDSNVTIDGGNMDITAAEGIESTYVLINDGNLSISATGDGVNAGQKVATYTPTIEINGGTLTIVMGQGDTDGIDSNGYIYINGGTINITAQSPFDYDKGAEYNGGTIIVNGEETNEITNQMMGGGMFGGGQGNMQFPGDGEQSDDGQYYQSQGGFGHHN